METYPVILGTAGHIDHGKTSLVRALTGIDTDRLKVEKERGITTELGFAHLDLKGRRFGVVDVPGHERFIKAMVAGATGLDLVCLVIAADEGIMPQTREHLDICELLGVRKGVVALTKADLVDEEWLELVSTEVQEHLGETFLSEAPIIPVSTVSGAGLDDLKASIVALTKDLPARSADGRLRLPVDRVFSVKGFGTVVTGTVSGGTVEAGDEVVLLPRGQKAKVRGIQVHGADVSRGRAGMRCAINLSQLSADEIARGDVLSHPGAALASHILDVRFRYLGSCKSPLPRRSQILVHHGTAQRMASLRLVDQEELAPGEEGLAQLRLAHEDALAAFPGDRFLARGFEAQANFGTTIGGGEVLRVHAPKVRDRAQEAKAMVEAMARASARDKVALEVKASAAHGRSLDELAQRTGMPPQELGAHLKGLGSEGTLVQVGKGKLAEYLHSEEFARLEKLAVDAVEGFHNDKPDQPGMPKAELLSRLPASLRPRFFEALVDGLLAKESLQALEDRLRRPGKGSMASEGPSPLEEELLERYRKGGNTPERPKELAAALGNSDKEIWAALGRLRKLGELIKVSDELFFHHEAIAALEAALSSHFEGEDELTPKQWKDIVGASRKFAIPLAEYFDREKKTMRVGEVRKARKL